MANQSMSVDDYVAIANMMGRYQHLVDAGDEDAWTALFTEDGSFHGLPEAFGPSEQFRGREGLKPIARITGSMNGKFRHFAGSFTVSYGETQDEAFADYYVLVCDWSKEGADRLAMFTPVRTHLVRTGEGWLIKSNTMAPL